MVVKTVYRDDERVIKANKVSVPEHVLLNVKCRMLMSLLSIVEGEP